MYHKEGDNPVKIDYLFVVKTGFIHLLAEFFSLNGWLITEVKSKSSPDMNCFEFRPSFRPSHPHYEIEFNDDSRGIIACERDSVSSRIVRLKTRRFLTEEEIEYGFNYGFNLTNNISDINP